MFVVNILKNVLTDIKFNKKIVLSGNIRKVYPARSIIHVQNRGMPISVELAYKLDVSVPICQCVHLYSTLFYI